MTTTGGRAGTRAGRHAVAGALLAATPFLCAAAGEPVSGDAHAHHAHLRHDAQAQRAGSYTRSVHFYRVPDVTLVDMAGSRVALASALDAGTPVFLNFIFTSCATICPVMSATFGQVQEQLGPEGEQVRMISISIDPEHDTPERLRAYATRHRAGSRWRFLTGEAADIVAVQKAFDAYRGGKMGHEPFTFLRASAGGPWVRLDGLGSATDLVAEYRRLVAR
ncbi:membrane protein [Sulfurifustis variabilis]|uniref:Membrane protein n=1 Tax=Sulfurifustis variabilis TaxID=1675686 RepID=A0A1C7AFG2_9GAMM|nr:SCO family protein [Sulfurifustis variabilis]BAU50055.1 membrane protein [Sulfurifustis variabilis]